MRIKGRTTRTALAGVFAIVAVWGMAPGIAAAEPHARTAPYDFGIRCVSGGSHDDGLYLYRCENDPVAIATGVIGAGKDLGPEGLRVQADSYYSSVGIYFDLDEPGRLSVTVELDHLVPDVSYQPYACAYVTNVDTGSHVGTRGCSHDQVQVTGWTNAGKHAVVVERRCYYPDCDAPLYPIDAALHPNIVKTITYEAATN